ncbi:hypothetical protein J7L87_03055 [bacterium]|nr:hypothetical protein [bacterium]
MEKTPIWEDITIILSIFTLWPSILRRESVISRIIMGVALFLMIWILYRRLKRINTLNK